MPNRSITHRLQDMVVPQGGGERELTGKYTKQQISASQGGLEMHCNGLEMD